MTRNPLDTAQQAVFVVGGVAALFLGYKLYQTVSGLSGVEAERRPRQTPWDYVDPNAPPVPGVASECGHDGEPSCQPPECHTESSWLGLKKVTVCDAPIEPDWSKAKDRSSRIRWGLEAGNEHTVLAALQLAGADLDAETDAFRWAGQLWTPGAEDDHFHRNEDAGKILLWWGANRAQAKVAKDAAAANDLVTLARFARGEII